MKTCPKCGYSFNPDTNEAEFRQQVEMQCSIDAVEVYDRHIYDFDEELCSNCNFEEFEPLADEYHICGCCNTLYRVEDSREEFEEYIFDLGYPNDSSGGSPYDAAMDEFSEYLCGKCNKDEFENHREEWEDENIGPFDDEE